MDIEEWATLNRLLDEALDLPPDARPAWIDNLAAAHDPLKPRLRRMLDVSAGSRPSLVLPQFDDDDNDEAVESPEPALHDEDLVGPYRLIRRLAEGGMGTVWLAQRADGLITRRVALKLPRGAWQRTALLERMAREREILSRLEHPNIGRLYDTGMTSQGQPYLALEYIEGRHVHDYCAHHGLDVAARLRLFLQVLDAVAHAHARLVVHRDLKPSNILVTAEGQVKLLDFGIAKIITEGDRSITELTRMAGPPLTPEYASPEQSAGEPLTIATDIYSLGVVLYELLTGQRPLRPPFDARAAAAPGHSDAGVPPPSRAASNPSFRSKLRGELDTIVLTALKPAPADRYATVNAFADDLRRHLRGWPILARPDSRWYRIAKFSRRHAMPLAAAAAALMAVLIGSGAALWQAQVARQEQRRAEEVKEFIASIFEGASPYAAAGQKLSAVDLLRHARSRIDTLENAAPELRAELLTIVGSSLVELMEVTAAEPILREAVDEATRSLGPEHPATLHAATALAVTHRFVGDPEQVAPELERLIVLLRAHPGSAEDLIDALESRALVAMQRARWDDAESSSREMLAVARSHFGERHPLALSARWSIVQSYLLAGRNAEAAAEADAVFPLSLEAYRNQPRAPELMEARELYGRVLTSVGRLQEGIGYMEQALADAAELFGADGMAIGFYAANLAARQLEAGDFDAALASIDRGLAVSAVLPGATSGLHAFSHHVRGRILLAARRNEDALAQLDLAIEKLRRSDDRSNQRVALAQSERALALAYTGRVDRALADLEALESPSPRILGIVQRLAGAPAKALASQQTALQAITPGAGATAVRASILAEIGRNHFALGDIDAAAQSLGDALALSRTLERRPVPEHADLLVALARAMLARQRPADALPLLEEAGAFWREFDSGNGAVAEVNRHLDRARAALDAH